MTIICDSKQARIVFENAMRNVRIPGLYAVIPQLNNLDFRATGGDKKELIDRWFEAASALMARDGFTIIRKKNKIMVQEGVDMRKLMMEHQLD